MENCWASDLNWNNQSCRLSIRVSTGVGEEDEIEKDLCDDEIKHDIFWRMSEHSVFGVGNYEDNMEDSHKGASNEEDKAIDDMQSYNIPE